jgi:hypothetical protein
MQFKIKTEQSQVEKMQNSDSERILDITKKLIDKTKNRDLDWQDVGDGRFRVFLGSGYIELNKTKTTIGLYVFNERGKVVSNRTQNNIFVDVEDDYDLSILYNFVRDQVYRITDTLNSIENDLE